MNRKSRNSRKSTKKRLIKSRKPRKSSKKRRNHRKKTDIIINKTTPKKSYKSRNLDYHQHCGSYEGRVIKAELYKINNLSRELYNLIEDHDDLPEWVNKKIFNMSMNIGSVYDYLNYKINRYD